MNHCTVHDCIEVLPGVWQHTSFVAQGATQNVRFEEAACPICIEIARESLRALQHCPVVLSTPAALGLA